MFFSCLVFFLNIPQHVASISRHVCVPVAEPGPPSPPDSVTVEEVTDSTAQLAWSRGRDNGSPITNYFVQTRTPFTVGWQRVNTGGQALGARLLGWNPAGKSLSSGRGQSGRVSGGMKGERSRFKIFLLRAGGGGVNVAAHI